MTVRAAWLTPGDQTREDTRLTLSGLLTINASAADNVPLKARGGIVPGGFALTGATGTMTFTIGTGRAFVQSARILQGTYPVAVTDPETLTVPDGDAQYGRIDLVELAVLDDDYDGTGSTTALVRLVRGTPRPSPPSPPPRTATPSPLPDCGPGRRLGGERRSVVDHGGHQPPLFHGRVGRDRPGVGLRRRLSRAVPRHPGHVPAVGRLGLGVVSEGGGRYRARRRADDGQLRRPVPGERGRSAPALGRLHLAVRGGPYEDPAERGADHRPVRHLRPLDADHPPDDGRRRRHRLVGVEHLHRAEGGLVAGELHPHLVQRVGDRLTWRPDLPERRRSPRATWLVGAGPGATSVTGTALLKCAAGDKLALYGLRTRAPPSPPSAARATPPISPRSGSAPEPPRAQGQLPRRGSIGSAAHP